MTTIENATDPRAAAVRDYARQTTGSVDLHAHWLRGSYTDGMAFVAETCGAHWLLDVVASHQPGIAARLRKHGLRDFQVWRLTYSPTRGRTARWVVDAWSDTPEAPEAVLLARQTIAFSDFPTELSGFEFYAEAGVVMLKEER